MLKPCILAVGGGVVRWVCCLIVVGVSRGEGFSVVSQILEVVVFLASGKSQAKTDAPSRLSLLVGHATWRMLDGVGV